MLTEQEAKEFEYEFGKYFNTQEEFAEVLEWISAKKSKWLEKQKIHLMLRFPFMPKEMEDYLNGKE